MLHPSHDVQQYIAIAADRHRRLLADAATYQQLTAYRVATGGWRRLIWTLGDLLLVAGAHLTAGRPHPPTPVHNSFT
jgi:hypothetical protein